MKDDNKACLRNTYFASIGEKLVHELLPSIMPLVSSDLLLQSSSVPSLSDVKLTEDSVLRLIKQMKATGPNGISPKTIELHQPQVSPHLTSLYRWSISHQTVYGSWKLARVSPIFEKDERTNPGYYQLVSLLSVRSKWLESEINTAVANNAMSNNLITPSQWAYRKMDMDMKYFLKIVITCFTFSVFIPTFHPHK